MKKTICLLFLLLTACARTAPTPSVTPTAIIPTATSTPEPTPTLTPTLTSTPDALHQAFNALDAGGINVSHEDSMWILKVGSADVPGAWFDEDGEALHIQIGDQPEQQFDIPLKEAADRLSLTDEGVLKFSDGEGNTLAAFGPDITAEDLEGCWFTESEVIVTSEQRLRGESPVVIGDR